MARRRVAVQIEAAGGLQHAVQLNQAHRHHGEIRHHVIFFQEPAHRAQQFGHIGVARRHHIVKRRLRLVIPVPRILERLDLAVRADASRRFEQYVVIGIRIERRVEIDKVDALARYVFAKHIEVIAIIEPVGHGRLLAGLMISHKRDMDHESAHNIPAIFVIDLGGIFMKKMLCVISALTLSGCSTVGALRTDLSADTIPTKNTEAALTNVLMEAFENGDGAQITFKKDPSDDEITRYLNAGFTLTDIYCDGFFRQTNLSFRKRKFGRGATNDVGTVITAILGLSSVGPKVISGVSTGFGLGDSTWRNYDESFVVSPELDTVRSLVMAAQDQFRRDTFDNVPTDYMTARSAVIRYAGLCSFLGMQSLLNQSVDQQRRQLQDAAKTPTQGAGVVVPAVQPAAAAPQPQAVVGAVPPS